jgi:predicted nucleotidyltransferase
MNKIMGRLQENYNTVVNQGYEIVGIFLQGSQNYQLEYEGSDIDCKAVVLPKFNDFVLNNKMVSTTLVLENNEHIDLKDIRLMFDCFKKQNINFVEILFTKYKILNPKYEVFWQRLIDNNELIAHYNNYVAVNCMAGMALEKYKALEHPYPATIDKIEKYGFDGKQLHHLLRLKEFISNYVEGKKYSDCLISDDRDYLIDVKCNKKYNLNEARKIAKYTVDFIVNYKNDYMRLNPVVVNQQVEDILNEVLVDIIKFNFQTELLGEINE